ncbi:hypothetical protein TRAPUB_8842 [Trametes pubescens]|uniref:Uncharacterized protein n=1 Tax=Trametes pubescens TaxID=154538 RepID=A0A1M2W462_TRAPU|nr:hypothetical protein TRAPUB_8842 [Trametes pubescens]
MNPKKAAASNVWPRGVKYLEATTERKKGESPNIDMLVPEAIPMYRGNVFVAAKTSEKYLEDEMVL